jgi:prepilin-type N-terminal cleavage/methylation domain-containing protein
MSRPRQGMTLIEILFALLILAIGVITIAMLLPVAVKTQQQVRFQLYAAAKAIDIADALAQSDTSYQQVVLNSPNTNAFGNDVEGVGDDQGTPLSIAARTDKPIAAQLRRRPAFQRPGRFDVEQLLTNMDLGAIPVPPAIARRLDSEGGEIQQVLDAGGMLYYADPVPLRNRARVNNTVSGQSRQTIAAEVQQLVFAVVGAPQAEVLPMSPLGYHPMYELYPFPPQALGTGATWAYDLYRDPNGDPYKFKWDNKHKLSAGVGGDRYQLNNWRYAARAEAAPPAVPVTQATRAGALGVSTAFLQVFEDSWPAFTELVYYGWSPIAFKLSNITSSTRDRLADGQVPPLTEWPDGRLLPPLPGSPRDFGERVTDYPGYDWYDLPSPIPAPLPVWHRLMPGFDPIDPDSSGGPTGRAVYGASPFNQGGSTATADQADGKTREFGKNVAKASMGTLEMRRYYRRLALRLWATTVGITDTDLDSAYDANYAVWNASGSYDPAKRFEVKFDAGYTAKNPLTQVIAPRPDLPGDWREPHPARVMALSYLAHAAMMCTGARFPDIVPGTMIMGAGDVATDEDRLWAQNAHATCLLWAAAYAAENPNDHWAPRPANRQLFTDKPLFEWDLFTSAGTRIAGDPAKRNRFDEPFARLIAGHDRPRWAPSEYNNVATWERILLTGFTDSGSSQTQPALWSQSSAGVNASAHRTITRPFQAGERTRQLVFWAVDWKSYQDAESVPSAPVDASLYANSDGSRMARCYGRGDHPEGHLMWSNAGRSQRCSNTGLGLSDEDNPGIGSWAGHFGRNGADRNGNGVFDAGTVPAGTHLRAKSVARFVVYDPVLRVSLRQ